MTLPGGTTPGQNVPRSNSNKKVLCIPQTPALQEPHYQIV